MSDHQSRSVQRRVPLAALLAGGILVLGALPAGAEDPKPLDDVGQQVEQTVTELPQPNGVQSNGDQSDQSAGATQRHAAAPPVAEDDDSEGHETPNPTAPDHGSSAGLEAAIADNDLVSVATTDSEIKDNHSSSADATALAIGGQEVVGSHADSGGDRNDSDGDPLAPLCDGSDGGVCATLLYSEAHASEGRTHSNSSARSGVASACLGGSDPTGDTCDGPIDAGVIESWSAIHRGPSGHTEAESGSSVADLCVERDPILGTCTVGVAVLESSGSSDSRGHAEKQSNVIGLELGGQTAGDFQDPTAIAIPPGCTSPSLVCLFLNQGETYLSKPAAGHAVEALHLSALDGSILAHAAQSETLVHKAGARNGGPKCPGSPSCPGGPGGPGGLGGPGAGPGDSAGPPSGGDKLLPDTGGFWSGLLPTGLLAIAMGALTLAWARRRELIDG